MRPIIRNFAPHCRTPPGVRELKQNQRPESPRPPDGRTPPGVRELKLLTELLIAESYRRTPPGVRELKLSKGEMEEGTNVVAPLPGCVN